MAISIQRMFINSIINNEYSKDDIVSKNRSLRENFLKIVPETEDNLHCLNHVEYGDIIDRKSNELILGLKLKQKNLLVSEVLNALEDMEEPPEEVKDYFPEITNDEWQAITRLITVIMFSFEKHINIDPSENKKSKIKKLIQELGGESRID